MTTRCRVVAASWHRCYPGFCGKPFHPLSPVEKLLGLPVKMIQQTLLALGPLFFAMNALGVVPVFIAMTTDLPIHDQRGLLRKAIFAAGIVSVVIVLLGKSLFQVMGITPNDFRIGGGILISLIGILDLIGSQWETRRRQSQNDIGVVPIGIPLIVGPGAMTTLIALPDSVGFTLTFVSLTVNLFFAWLVFHHSYLIVRFMGAGGTRAFGKVSSLFLTAIGVMMIRIGLTGIISGS